jgi:hypothetical protein
MASNPADLIAIAQATKQTYAESERLVASLGLQGEATLKLIQSMKRLESVNATSSETFAVLSTELGITQNQFNEITETIARYKKEQQQVGKESKGFFETVVDGATQASSAYYFISNAISNMAAVGGAAYKQLIGQNVELQQELLSTQASLASTNRIFQDGIEVTDPSQAITALIEPVNAAVKQIREGSLELVGVTSKELIPIYQMVSQNAASIGASLTDAADLTLTFAAALGTIGLPLYQARQEIQSIFLGYIDQNSLLAKTTNITNEMVAKWKAQGTVVENLTKKLEAFRAGNVLAAQTINGVTSNIVEVFDEISRASGEGLLKPISDQLTLVYNLSRDSRNEIQNVAKGIIDFFLNVASQLQTVFKPLLPVLSTLFEAIRISIESLATSGRDTINILVLALAAAVTAGAPLLQVLADLLVILVKIQANPLGEFIVSMVLLMGILSPLAPVVGLLISGISLLIKGSLLLAGSLLAPGGLIGVLVTLHGMVVAFGASLIAFGAAMIPIAVAAAPFAAALIAIYNAHILLKELELGDVNDALTEYRQQTEGTANAAIKTAQSLKLLNDEQHKNGFLSKDQAKEKARLQKVASNEVIAIQAQIASIKELNTLNPEQKASKEALIKQQERMIAMSIKQSEGVRLESKGIEEKGNLYGQLAKKVEEAANQIERGASGDEQFFMTQAKAVIDFTQKQNQQGLINRTSAVARLEKIRDDVRIDIDTQISALSAIQAIRTTQMEKYVGDFSNSIAAIQALEAKGVISSAESAKKVSEEKRRQIEYQIKYTKQQIDWTNEQEALVVKKQVEIGNKEIAELEKKRDDSNKKGDIGGARIADEKIQKLKVENDITQATLKIDSQAQQKLKTQKENFSKELETIKKAESDRLKQLRLDDHNDSIKLNELTSSYLVITQKEAREKTLAAEKAYFAEKSKQIEGNRAKLNPKDKEGLEALNLAQAEANKRLFDGIEKNEVEKTQNRQNFIKLEESQLNEKYAKGLITQHNFNSESLKLTNERLDIELAQIKRQKEKTPSGDKERLATLQQQEIAINTERIAANEQSELAKVAVRQTFIKLEESQLSEKYAKGLITQQNFSSESLKLTNEGIAIELAEIERQKKEIPTQDKQRLAVLEQQEIAANQRRLAANEQSELAKVAVRESFIKLEESQLSEKYTKGLVNEEQFYKESLRLTEEGLDIELAEIQRQKKRIPEQDKERLVVLEQQEIAANQRRLAANENFLNQQLALISRNQKATFQVVQESNARRNIEISQMEADLTIDQVEANLLRGQAARDVALEEIKIEKNKIAELEKLKTFDKGEGKRKERESEIRDLKISLANKTNSLIRDEIQQRNNLYQVYERNINKQIQKQEILADKENKALERKQNLISLANKSLSIQNSLVSQQISFANVINGYYQTQLSILGATTTNEREKGKIQEAAAIIALKATERKLEVEEMTLEIAKQQRDAALEMEQIQLRRDKLRGESDILKAIGNVNKIDAKPDATKEDKQIAKIDLDVAIKNRAILDLEGGVIEQKKLINSRQDRLDKEAFKMKSETDVNQSLLTLANARTDPNVKRNSLENLNKRVGRQLAEFDGRGGDIIDFANDARFIRRNNNGEKILPPQMFGENSKPEGLEGELQRLEAQIRLNANLSLEKSIPLEGTKTVNLIPQAQALSVPPLQSQIGKTDSRQSLDKLTEIANTAKETVSLPQSIVFNFNNKFSSEDAKNSNAAKTNADAVRKEFKDILLLVNRK